MKFLKTQPASALLITLLVLGGVFIIVFGASYLVFFNTKGSDTDSQSIKAYYASLGGQERLRYERRKAALDIKNCGDNLLTGTLTNSSTYQIDCNSNLSPAKIISRGLLNGFERSLDTGYCFDIKEECTSSCAIGSICGGGTLMSHNPNLVVAPSNNEEGGCSGGYDCGVLDIETFAYANTTTSFSAISETDGRDNVTAINAWIAGNGGSLSDFPAFNVCDALDVTAFSDWYLPAKDELNLLLRNSDRCENNTEGPDPKECLNASRATHPNIFGFADNFYRSSTENGAGFSYMQNFSDGKVDGGTTNLDPYSVRCLRRF